MTQSSFDSSAPRDSLAVASETRPVAVSSGRRPSRNLTGPLAIAVIALVVLVVILSAIILTSSRNGGAASGPTVPKYNVTFAESGLPAGTEWWVVLAGVNESSSTTTTTFEEPNGTYSFVIHGVDGYIVNVNGNYANVASGNVSVLGPISSVVVVFVNGYPIGTAFQAGNPTSSNSIGSGAVSSCATTTTTLTGAIKTADWTYTLTIESSSITFGSIGFEVKSSHGLVLAWTAGGFYIVNTGGTVVACGLGTAAAGFSAVSGLVYTTGGGLTASNSLSTLYTITIDTGSLAAANPWTGVGNYFVGVGMGEYSGTTGAVTLP